MHPSEVLRESRLADAAQQYRSAIAIKPDYAEAHNNLGNTLARLGLLDEAVQQYNQVLNINAVYAEAHYNPRGSSGSRVGELTG